MTPYYDWADTTIYHAKAEAVLPALAANSIDLIVTDPPYNEVNRDSGGLRKLNKGVADSAPIDIPSLAAEFVRVVRGSIYVWCGVEQVSAWRREFVKAGLTVRAGVWVKTNPSPMNGDKLWLSGVELCVFARKPKATFNRFCAVPAWTGPSEDVPGFECPKPEWLIKELILASSNPGDLVGDFFLGSGTTLRAAKDLGRRALGVEMVKRHCDLSIDRLAQDVLPLAV